MFGGLQIIVNDYIEKPILTDDALYVTPAWWRYARKCTPEEFKHLLQKTNAMDLRGYDPCKWLPDVSMPITD